MNNKRVSNNLDAAKDAIDSAVQEIESLEEENQRLEELVGELTAEIISLKARVKEME